LDDTVQNYPPEEATGFKFNDYNGDALLGTVRAACREWVQSESWEAMMVRGMEKNFSWEASAAEYSRLYLRLHPSAA
jgi:starch synthase